MEKKYDGEQKEEEEEEEKGKEEEEEEQQQEEEKRKNEETGRCGIKWNSKNKENYTICIVSLELSAHCFI
ncbi:hypothetical protein M8J75_000961 [Diaphorina citri]|nr:hypothetical protein M8J75_000961 [Diaphorina citri]